MSAKQRYWIWAAVTVLLLSIPAVGRADDGTAVLWPGVFELLIVNSLIGVLEGALLARIYRCRYGYAIGVMICANYFSAFIGYFALGYLDRFSYFESTSVYLLVGIAYLTSILLEWPFCYVVLGSSRKFLPPRPIWTALVASCVAQTASYALLVPCYVWTNRPGS